METPKFIAYYWVSTDRQGHSGLGLEAQQQAVCGFLAGRGELIESFTEIESGRKMTAPNSCPRSMPAVITKPPLSLPNSTDWQREMASLWLFLIEHDVESTNNRAERALRFGVLWRKTNP